MKTEYDFSNGIRGKFYNKNATFNLPVYLDHEIEIFFMELAKKQGIDLTQIINKILTKDKELMQAIFKNKFDSNNV